MEEEDITAGDTGNAMLKSTTTFHEVLRRLSEIQWNLWTRETNGEVLFPPRRGGLKALRGKQQRKENLRGIPISCLCA